jgi:curved DNA-binding protein CbpA
MLGVARGAEQEVIDAAYLALLKKHHPDHNPEDEAGANARTQQLNAANDLIGTEAKRRAFDARAAPSPPAPAAPPQRPHRRISVGRYFRRGEPGEARPLRPSAVVLIGVTLLLLGYWLVGAARNLDWSP